MRNILIIFIGLSSFCSNAQTASDLFKEDEITYLGIDFSHVQLLGNFSQAYGFGEQNSQTVRDNYFPAWNNVIMDERNKYDIAGMLRKDQVLYMPKMIMEINKNADVEELDVYNAEEYSSEQIIKFVSEYPLEGETGIGVLFIAESLNKIDKKAVYHFLAINMANGHILLQERLEGTPNGIGIRNYWAGSVYNVIQQIQKSYYRKWKKQYS